MDQFIIILYTLTLLLNAAAITTIAIRNNKRFQSIREYFEKKGAVREGKSIMVPDSLTRNFLKEYTGRWGTLRLTKNERYWFDNQRYIKGLRTRTIAILLFLLLVAGLLIISVFSIF